MSPQFAGILLLTATVVSAGLVPSVEVLQGPSSRTTVLGPDGSALSASAPGGTVVTNDGGRGLVAAGPAILASNPEIVVAGPAGSIATVNTLAGPAVVPAVIPGAPVVAAASPAVLVGNLDSAEGAYIPDNTELLHDDGSYRGEK